MKMIDHNHFICHLILGTFTEYPFLLMLFTQQIVHCFYRIESAQRNFYKDSAPIAH